MVGGDSKENPNNTLIMSIKGYDKYGKEIQRALTALKFEYFVLAQNVKDAFKISGYQRASEEDYAHTFYNIERAKIEPLTFNFKWEE